MSEFVTELQLLPTDKLRRYYLSLATPLQLQQALQQLLAQELVDLVNEELETRKSVTLYG